MALSASSNTDRVLSSIRGGLSLHGGHAFLIFKPGSFRFLETIMGGQSLDLQSQLIVT